METPDFLVQDEVYENPVFSIEEAQMAQRNPQQKTPVHRNDYAVNQVLLGNSIFDPARLNIKVEQPFDNGDPVMDATDDENVAVEALRSLSGARPKDQPEMCQKAPEYIPPHQCPICKERFERVHELNNHLVCHASSRPHACRLCGSLFLQKQDLHNHLTTHGISITQMHQCKHCGHQFTRLSALTNHMKIHSYTAGRAIVDKIGDTNELEDILTGNSDPEMEAVNNTRQKLVLPSINNISLAGSAAWALNYESESYNGMNLSDIHPNIPNLTDKTDDKPTPSIRVASSSLIDNSALLAVDAKDSKEKRPYKCEKCNKGFAREKAYVNHINNVNNHFACDRCEQHFPSERALEGHKRYCGNNATNEVKPARIAYKPDGGDCGVKSEYDQATFEKRYKHVCEVCQKRFNTKQKLFRHVWIHRKKMYICEVCSASFEYQKDLDLHRKEKHPSGGPYDCSECGKNFCSRQGLWEHGRTHTKDTTFFRCEECEKTFTSRQGFLIHKRKHSNERPYGCKFCMKSFRDGGTLRKHERIHTGERPHACPICSKTFNQKVVLREHVRWLHAHTAAPAKDGSYACQLCATSFAEKDELSAHYMKHSDQLARMAKEASKSNIMHVVSGATASDSSLPKPTKTETDVSLNVSSLVSCDVEINEEEMPLLPNYAQAGGSAASVSSHGQENGVEKMPTYFEMTQVPPPAPAGDEDYKPKIKVKELLREPLKLECVPEEEVIKYGDMDVECDLCGIWLKNKEALSCHIRVHI